MRICWYGQSTFSLASGGVTVFIDPFGAMDGISSRGMRFAYPAIEDATADLLLVTHEHADHNAIEVVSGYRQLVRSTAGCFDTAIGQIVAINSEHDAEAGTRRGPNTIFVFDLAGTRVCHFGDFGQSALRPEQRTAIGSVDLLLLPVGGGPTIGGAAAETIVRELQPKVVVPMHYRTEALNFLEPADDFLGRFADVRRLETSAFDLPDRAGTTGEATVLVPAVPL